MEQHDAWAHPGHTAAVWHTARVAEGRLPALLLPNCHTKVPLLLLSLLHQDSQRIDL